MVQHKCSRISRGSKDKGEEVIYTKDNDKFPELKRQVCSDWKGKLIPNKSKAKIKREIT